MQRYENLKESEETKKKINFAKQKNTDFHDDEIR